MMKILTIKEMEQVSGGAMNRVSPTINPFPAPTGPPGTPSPVPPVIVTEPEPTITLAGQDVIYYDPDNEWSPHSDFSQALHDYYESVQ
jgi:bacteriocin-like protein